MDIEKKLTSLRNELKERSIDAYLVTGTDPHQSEYVAPRWRTRAFISGFTGSAGTVVITQDKALLWVDSRYFIQAEKEIENTEYEMMKLEVDDTPDPYRWLKENLEKGAKVGVDASSVSIALFSSLSADLKEKGIILEATDDLLDPIWENRPAVPCTECEEMSLEYAGKSAAEKVEEIRKKLIKIGLLLTFIA